MLDRWIGYYPSSLFGAGTDASRSLQTGASQINYDGEIYDSYPEDGHGIGKLAGSQMAAKRIHSEHGVYGHKWDRPEI